MMMCQPIKFGCKAISSSVYIAETDLFIYMTHPFDLAPEVSQAIFSNDTLAHDGALTCRSAGRAIIEIENFRCYLDLD